jgi:hypothetical protein
MKTVQIIIYVISAILLFGGGMLTNSKMQRPIKLECPPCPNIKCPPNVTVNTLSLDDLKKLKIKGGFTFSPVYNGSVYLKTSNVDTLTALNEKK